ncbi:MAG: hypothetical protein LBC38_00445 [Oscillospiraceae bacterium]|jgi:hypothetical protein|nr:hypothetical protein [Oscillospiraceae bacterium]
MANRVKFSERPIVKWVDGQYPIKHGTAIKEISSNRLSNTGFINIIFLSSISTSNINNSSWFSKVALAVYVAFILAWEFFALRKIFAHRKYFEESLNQGGKIINAWNYKAIKLHWQLAFPVLSMGSVLYLGIISILASVYTEFQNWEPLVFLVYLVLIVYLILEISYSSTHPIIFFDLDKGVIFGGTLFPYDALDGISPDLSDSNEFALRREKEQIAYGRILPEDLAYLQQMITLKKKYGDSLDGIKVAGI